MMSAQDEFYIKIDLVEKLNQISQLGLKMMIFNMNSLSQLLLMIMLSQILRLRLRMKTKKSLKRLKLENELIQTILIDLVDKILKKIKVITKIMIKLLKRVLLKKKRYRKIMNLISI